MRNSHARLPIHTRIWLAIVFLTGIRSFLAEAAGPVVNATAYSTPEGIRIQFGVWDEEGIAWAKFEDSLHTTGWGIFEVKTSPRFPDYLQARSAGYLEGALTASRIYEHYLNMLSEFFDGNSVPKKISEFFLQQDQWVKTMLDKHLNTEPLWSQLNNVQGQLQGLEDGYGLVSDADKKLSRVDFLFLQNIGDMLDLEKALGIRAVMKSKSSSRIKNELLFEGRCSGFIKVTGDFSNLFVAHSTWFTYQAMNRIFKHYHLSYNDPSVSTKLLSFSSYPGVISSLDDFYILDSGLMMIQTTNSVLNYSLYDSITPNALSAWQRVRLANTLASSGKSWYETVRRYNSGTYNNQYMIIDLKLFTPKEELKEGLLWVIEQIPGLVVGEDLTNILKQGYWSSYNVPYFKTIYEKSGYSLLVEEFDSSFSHQLAARAQIFRRDQGSVVDLPSLMKLMRSNDYKNDPYSYNDPMRAICSRGDLIDPAVDTPRAKGCYDTKITDFYLASQLTSFALSGPTTDHGMKPFSWSSFNSTVPLRHEGMPDTYSFGFVEMKPDLDRVFSSSKKCVECVV